MSGAEPPRTPSQGPSDGPSDGSAQPSAPAPTASPPQAPQEGEGSLTITVSDGGGGTRTWTLTCGPGDEAGGDHPDPAAACAALRTAQQPFAPVPRDMMCTQVYGGPETATVRGTWQGRQVHASYRRTDGCEISRWNRIAPVLQPGQPPAGGSAT